MIIGIGTDLLEISRVGAILEQRSGKRFLERVLTPKERELTAQRKERLAEFTAGRFAAKEAIAKAFGCGIGKELSLQDVEVLPDEKGKPQCRLSEAAWVRLFADPHMSSKTNIHISISHTGTTAMAYAVIERIEGS